VTGEDNLVDGWWTSGKLSPSRTGVMEFLLDVAGAGKQFARTCPQLISASTSFSMETRWSAGPARRVFAESGASARIERCYVRISASSVRVRSIEGTMPLRS